MREKYGLQQYSMYSIKDAKEYNGLKLIKLRSPRATYEWLGDYSNISDLWTPTLKEKFGFE